MKILGLLPFLILAQTCLAQFNVTNLDKNTIPKSIHYTGKLVQAVRWTDSTGDNIIILTATGNIPSKDSSDEGFSDADLYTYHFLISGDSIKQTWRVSDHIKDCSFDIFLYFIDKAFVVTDLNKDGKAEVWIMYKVSCQSDVSPIPMKIIMYQDNKKFAARVTTKVKISANEYIGGKFNFDDAFKNGPAEFRQYAEKLWKQHIVETWEQ